MVVLTSPFITEPGCAGGCVKPSQKGVLSRASVGDGETKLIWGQGTIERVGVESKQFGCTFSVSLNRMSHRGYSYLDDNNKWRKEKNMLLELTSQRFMSHFFHVTLTKLPL